MTTLPAVSPPTGLIGSAQRALRVLEVVAAASDGITAKAVARRAGFKLSTTYHLLNTLVHEGYVIRLGHGRGFALGYKIGGLFASLCEKLDAGDRVRHELAVLHRHAGAAAYYAVFRDRSAVVAAVADSTDCPRALDVGFHDAGSATAFGRVLLEKTCPGGLACDLEEFQAHLACLAAAVRDGGGEIVGAVALSVPAPTFPARRPHLERTLLTGAERITRIVSARTPL